MVSTLFSCMGVYIYLIIIQNDYTFYKSSILTITYAHVLSAVAIDSLYLTYTDQTILVLFKALNKTNIQCSNIVLHGLNIR